MGVEPDMSVRAEVVARPEGVATESVSVAARANSVPTAVAEGPLVSATQADVDMAGQAGGTPLPAAPVARPLQAAREGEDVTVSARTATAMQDVSVANSGRPHQASASSEVTDLVGKDMPAAPVGNRPEGQRLATDPLPARQEGAAQAAQLQTSSDTGESADSGQQSRQEGQGTATAALGRSGNATPATSVQAGPTFAQQLQQQLAEPRWGHQLGERAIMMAQHGPRTAHIQLDPPELGALQIRVHLQGQDQVSVSFTSANPAVRDALEQQLPRLREMFADQGLSLQDSSVSDEASRQGSGQREQAESFGRPGGYGGTEDGETDALPAPAVALGMVDYYA